MPQAPACTQGRPRPIAAVLATLLATGTLPLTGCAVESSPVVELLRVDRLLEGTPPLTANQRDALRALDYPREAPLHPDDPQPDVLAIRRGGTVQLVNRTPRPMENRILWLNEQYAGRVDQLAVGVNPPMDLDAFINTFGEPYPTARWLEPDRAAPLIHATLHDPGRNTRQLLTVQPPIPD